MNPDVVGHEPAEDFAFETLTTVTPPTPHGICVNCGRQVTLQRVATDPVHHTYQWVPDGDIARPGRWCNEGSLPAFHWAADATAAVYHLST